jgi:hypothetical protein
VGEPQIPVRVFQSTYPFAGFQLIDLGRHDERISPDRSKPGDGLTILFGDDSAIHQQHDSAQRVSVDEIALRQRSPLDTERFRDPGKSITRQVNEIELGETGIGGRNAKHVHGPRFPRCPTDFR